MRIYERFNSMIMTLTLLTCSFIYWMNLEVINNTDTFLFGILVVLHCGFTILGNKK